MLQLSIGQYSHKGVKHTNQDFHGALIPEEPLRTSKGIAVILADGISSSQVSRIAAEATVKTFLSDYYCTSETWSVRTAARRVIAATNSWLYAQTRRSQNPYDRDKGHVCTLALAIFKSRTVHVFHVGDSRVYRLAGAALEQLTEDHRIAISASESYLSRALGVNQHVEVDYRAETLAIGDTFVLATDGVYDFIAAAQVADATRAHFDDLAIAARLIVETALENGSTDNLTVQIVRVDGLPEGIAEEAIARSFELPVPPPLEARAMLDGFTIVRPLHQSSRSHVYLARPPGSDESVTIKVPAADLGADPENLKRFAMEEWVARRISNAHVLKPIAAGPQRTSLYFVAEYIDGITLSQWMIDHPAPDLETVRQIIDQIARGLQAFHRLEMIHQDVRPENIMIDRTGTVKIVDFGSVKVSGILEAAPTIDPAAVLGTVQYTAPECLRGDGSLPQSDVFSLGVIAYQMLTGRLPYGARMAMARTRAQQARVRYESLLSDDRALPMWLDDVLRKAVHLEPHRRFLEPLEFAYALRVPPEGGANSARKALIERNPLAFWKGLSALLMLIIVLLLAWRR